MRTLHTYLLLRIFVMVSILVCVACSARGTPSPPPVRTEPASTTSVNGTAMTLPPPFPSPRPRWVQPPDPVVAYCDIESIALTPTSVPLDQIIPGQSTEAEVLALLGAPSEEIFWAGQTKWWYQPYRSWVVFQDEVVIRHSDPRTSLGDILTKYGSPSRIIWVLPKFDYHDAMEVTYLLYPQQGALFEADRQVLTFGPDTHFYASDVVEPSRFDSLVAEKEILIQTEWDWSVEVEWPCAIP